MAFVHARGAEAFYAELLRLSEQLGLVQTFADRSRSARDQREMGEADLAHTHRDLALAQALKLLADANPITGCATWEMAIGFDPGNRAVEALLVVLVRLGKLSRE